MKNAAVAWLASDSMQYASSFNFQKINAASHFSSIDSVQSEKVSASAVSAGTVLVAQPDSLESAVRTESTEKSKLGAFASTVIAVFGSFGQRRSDQLIKKQYQMAAEEPGNNQSEGLESINAQTRYDDLERIKRFEYSGL